jgi:hypothetical protein
MQTEQLTQQIGIPISPGFGPANTTANANVGPIDMLKYNRVLAHVALGVVGTASNVQAYFQGSNTSTGGFANLSGANTLTLSTSNTEGTLEMRSDQLAVTAGNRYLQLVIALNGANASFVYAQVFGAQGPYKPQSQYDNANLANLRLVM